MQLRDAILIATAILAVGGLFAIASAIRAVALQLAGLKMVATSVMHTYEESEIRSLSARHA